MASRPRPRPRSTSRAPNSPSPAPTPRAPSPSPSPAPAPALTSPAPPSGWGRVGLLIKLGRPKFLAYSLACHLVGTLTASLQGRPVDGAVFFLLQLTIWLTHLMTHYWNEYGDYEVDLLNANAGSWTGGSKVLRAGLLRPADARRLGALLLFASFIAGAATVWRYLVLAGAPPSLATLGSWAGVRAVLGAVPWGFVGLGVSVFAVALAYSLPPLRLSAHALGELAVSYVLTFVTPATGLLVQRGALTAEFLLALLPLFLINAARMVVMNIPDRAGDAAGHKVTSVVLLGEERAVQLNNLVYLATYLAILPALPLPPALKVAYCVPLPLRWWQSLRVNSPGWWRDGALTDSIPFVESLYVLASVTALAAGLAYLQA